MGGKERDVVVLTKLRPFEEWGNFNYKVEIVHPKQGAPNVNNGGAAVQSASVNVGNDPHDNFNFEDLVD